MQRPRGGRLLMIEKAIPLACSLATAACVGAVNIFSLVTRVPSTSEITAEHLNRDGRVLLQDVVDLHRH